MAQSKAFLLALRKTYKLGEFRNRKSRSRMKKKIIKRPNGGYATVRYSPPEFV